MLLSEVGWLIMRPYCCVSFTKLLMSLWLSKWMKFLRLLWRFMVAGFGRTARSSIRERMGFACLVSRYMKW